VQSEEGGTGHGCLTLSDEFFQYWLGAYENAPAGGSASNSGIAPVDGVRTPFDGLSWTFGDDGLAAGRNAAAYTATFETIGAAYPSVAGRTAARYRVHRDPAALARYGNAIAAAVETPDSVLFGFGFEDIATADLRAAVMGRALRYLQAPR
jgi:hypothetical protein